MNKKFFLISALILLLASINLTIRVQKVKASDTIYISENGEVDGTDKITSIDNVTYTFTDNINDSIWIRRNNIILDGANFSLESGGVVCEDRINITIKNINIIGPSTGIYLDNSTNCSIIANNLINISSTGVYVYMGSNFNNISENNIVSSGNGVWLRDVSNCTVSNNNITCEREFAKFGVYLYYSSSNIISSNIIAQCQACIYFYYSSYNMAHGNNLTNSGWGQDGGGVWSERSHFNNIHGNHISESSWYGIELYRSSNNSVSENEVTSNNNRGIMIHTLSSSNNITGNNVTKNYKGIELSSSSHNNTLSGNKLSANTYEAIMLDYSGNNTISGNTITDASTAILVGSDYNNLTFNVITNSGRAIYLNQGSHNYLHGNNLTDNNFGLSIQSSTGNIIRETLMLNNTCSFSLNGFNLPHFINDVDESNTVEHKPIYYWIDAHNSSVPEDAACIILVECTNITAQSLNLSICNWQGVAVAYSRNITIADNYIANNDEYTIWLRNSSDCVIARNYLKGFISVKLDYSSNNTVFGNTFTSGGNWGSVNLLQSSNNTFYHNNFTDNYIHYLLDDFSVNNWDDGYPSGGNYWDNYLDRYSFARDENSGPYQNITGSGDGIWDTPYTLNSNNIDNYPIVPEFSSLAMLTLIMTGTLLAFAFRKRKVLG